jgi:hypothetical protein
VTAKKLNGVEPQMWLTDRREPIVLCWDKGSELGQLLPWTWNAEAIGFAGKRFGMGGIDGHAW